MYDRTLSEDDPLVYKQRMYTQHHLHLSSTLHPPSSEDTLLHSVASAERVNSPKLFTLTMKSCKHREQRIDSLLHSCPVLCTELGPQGLARLATTSSGLRGACQSILNLGAASWLVSSLGIDNKAQRLQAAV
jgi:hypothetical protein